jgi:hypothetical protein
LTPLLINPLQERGESTEEGGDTDDGDVGTGEEGSTGGGGGGTAAGGRTGAGAGGTVGSGGVVVGGIAAELTLDNVLVLELLEVRAREVTVGRLHVESTLNILKSTERDLVEGTAEVNGTVDTLEAGERDDVKVVITGDGETTIDGLQDGHGDVGELAVVLEDQVTSVGEVGSGESLELGAPETELTGKLLERRHGHSRDVLEGHALTSAEVGEVDLEGIVVTGEADGVGGVLQVVDVDGLQITVVLDAEETDGLQGDTVEVSQTSVGDADITGLGDTLGEAQGLELGESIPVDAANTVKLGEVEEGDGGETLKVEGLADAGEGRGSDGANVSTLVASEATGDLLDTAQGKVAHERLVNGDVTLDGVASVDAIGVALGLNLGITAVGAGEDHLAGGQRGEDVLERHDEFD